MSENGGWEDHAVRDERGAVVDVVSVPGGETHEHFYKKVVMADQLTLLGHQDVELEDDKGRGVRFDVFAPPIDRGKAAVAVEIGVLNTPARKVVKKFEQYYEWADFLVWWPFDEDCEYGHPPLRYIDPLHMAQTPCEECYNGFAGTINSWFFPTPPWHCPPTLFILEHLFDPVMAHENMAELE